MNNQEEQAINFLHRAMYDHKQTFFHKIPEIFKTIIIVSSGMISLVVLLHRYIVPQDAQQILLVRLAIALLFLVVVSGLAALYGFAQIHLDTIKDIQEEIQKHGPVEVLLRKQYSTFQQKTIYTISHYLAIFSFLISLIFLTLFTWLNI
jgi:hypothetical protein